MLNASFMKAHTDEQLTEFIEETKANLAMAGRQRQALIRTREARPDFVNYCPIAEDYITIDTYIEMQDAIQGEIEDELALLAKEHDKRRGLNQTIRML